MSFLKLQKDYDLFMDPNREELDRISTCYLKESKERKLIVFLSDPEILKNNTFLLKETVLVEDNAIDQVKELEKKVELSDELLFKLAEDKHGKVPEDMKKKILEHSAYSDIVDSIFTYNLAGTLSFASFQVSEEPILFFRIILNRIKGWRRTDKVLGSFSIEKKIFLQYLIQRLEYSFRKTGNRWLPTYFKCVLKVLTS